MNFEHPVVAEFAGTYGTVSILETVFQQIWRDQVVEQTQYRSVDDQLVDIIDCGDLNRLAGPDFKNAKIRVDGQTLYGDIELHLDAVDWNKHRHQSDPAYQKVILHVFLFDSSHQSKKRAKTEGFTEICFLPYLERDIESYAEEMDLYSSLPSGWTLSARPEEFADATPSEKRAWCFSAAKIRWELKKKFALFRLKHLSISEVWHHSFLHALGYPRNRNTMFALANQFPSKEWKSDEFSVDLVYSSFAEEWKTQGLRPANHPKLRLEQYLGLYQKSPHWQNLISKFIIRDISYGEKNFILKPLSEWRRELEIAKNRECLVGIMASQWTGGFLDTLVVDVILPTLSAIREIDYFPQWFSWYSGNFPEKWKSEIAEAEIVSGVSYPHANGWNQAWIEWKNKKTQ